MIYNGEKKYMAKYVKCPRCELNFMLEGEEYCDVCKAELKKGPQLVFAVEEEEEVIPEPPKVEEPVLFSEGTSRFARRGIFEEFHEEEPEVPEFRRKSPRRLRTDD